jgi:hypothetical protein
MSATGNMLTALVYSSELKQRPTFIPVYVLTVSVSGARFVFIHCLPEMFVPVSPPVHLSCAIVSQRCLYPFLRRSTCPAHHGVLAAWPCSPPKKPVEMLSQELGWNVRCGLKPTLFVCLLQTELLYTLVRVISS